MRLWFTRLAAAVVVIAGPALLLCAAADYDPHRWLGWNGFPWPANFQAAAACGYALAIGLVNAQYRFLRTLAAAIGCVILPVATAVLASPIMFGLSGASAPLWMWASAMAVFALPTALLQVLALRDRHSARILQILAHLIAASGVLLTANYLYSEHRQLYSNLPALLVLIPFVALAMRGPTPHALWRFVPACFLALLPVYIAKTMLDARTETMERAATWPARVHRDYMSPAERSGLVKRVTMIQPGVPARIGEHWYRFKRIGQFQNPSAGIARRPDRITQLQLDIPVEDIDLREITSRGHIQLNITVVNEDEALDVKKRIEKTPTWVAIIERDLLVHVFVSPRLEIDRNVVREKIRRFIQKARVDPPAR